MVGKELLDKTDKMDKKWSFSKVQDPSVLLAVLKERHPISCMIYNQVVQNQHFKDEVTFYTIGESVNSNTWIVSNNVREDYGNKIVISAPVAVVEGKERVPEQVKECFLNGGLFNWDMTNNKMIFMPMPIPVGNMIVEISAEKVGNVTEVTPGVLFFLERDDALKLDVSHKDPSVKLRRLDASKNETDFILKNWNYAQPGSEKVLPKYIEKSASGGLFVDGKLVCGVHCPALGWLSALYTLRDFRNRGFAKLTMNYTFKEYAKDGCIPCLNVDRQNVRSIQFHEGLGLKVASKIFIIKIKNLDVD